MVPPLSYIAGFSDCAACRLGGLTQSIFGLETGETEDAAEVIHRPIGVHRSHDEVLGLSYRPVREEEEGELLRGILFFWR